MKILRCPTRKRSGEIRRTLTRSSRVSSLKRLNILRYALTGIVGEVGDRPLAQRGLGRRPSELEEPVGFFSTSCVGPRRGWGNSHQIITPSFILSQRIAKFYLGNFILSSSDHQSMFSMDWMNIGMDALSLIVSFIIVTVLATFFLWLIDKALPEVDFLTIRDDPKAKAIASLGWLILYALVFAGAIIAPYSLDVVIVRQVVWTFVMLLTASVLTIVAVKFVSPSTSLIFSHC